MELWDEINTELTLLNRAVAELRVRGRAYAEAEYKYRVALSKRLTVLRAEGNPVTNLSDIARGEQEIASLKMQRDIAESLYQSNLEAINAYKLKLKLLDNQLGREWGVQK